MIALNSIALDLIPYALRTIFHASKLPWLIRLTSGLLLILVVFDFCEIYHLGGNSKITEYKAQKNSLGLEDRNSSALDLLDKKAHPVQAVDP